MTDTTQTPAETPVSVAPTDPTPPAKTAPAQTDGKPPTESKAPATGKAPAGDTAFYDSWDAKLKDSPVVLRHKSVEDLARSLVAAEAKFGVPADQLIRKPTKPEDMADVYRALGAPEKPEDYKIGLPDGATDDDKAVAGRFAQHMFDKGPFPPDAVAAAVEFINGETTQADAALVEAQKTAREAGSAWLKKELGATFDPEFKAVGDLLVKHGPPGLAEELDLTGAGDNPKLTRFLHTVMDLMAEPGPEDVPGGKPVGSGILTPGQAKAARIGLENDPVKGPALRDDAHPMHKAVVEERNRYFALEAGRAPED